VTLASALRSGDVSDLPGRRSPDWRWSELSSLFTHMPPPSPERSDCAPNPRLEDLAASTILYLNGRRLHPEPTAPRARLVRRFVSTSEDAGHHLDVSLDVPAGEQLVLIDSFEGHSDRYLASTQGEIRVAEGAEVERIVLLDDAPNAVSVCRFDVELEPRGRFSQTVLAAGSRRQRVETRVRAGAASFLRLDGVYLLDGTRHSDQTTEVVHDGLGGASAQLVKGLAAGRSRSVFQGRIVVAEGANGTDARMGSHAILLADTAEVDAKPELEIYADDVQCSHGNTVGALNEDALFYARSRGIPEAEARALLAAAFVAEVAERIVDAGARRLALDWIERRLGGIS
jgi:Fe-S cluster assembly protein SufD